MAPTYEPKAKRRKLEKNETKSESAIKSAQDLNDLLRFKQSSSPDVKNGIQKFKDFLTDIAKAEDSSDRVGKFQILKEFCDRQSSGDKPTTCFPDLISTWSFAAQSNNDIILSAVPAVLALFLRTISTQIQFREFGLSLCRTLLEKDQLRLFDQGLTSPKTKSFLISPCLRLLTEIVSFDGGAVANSLYARRDITFKRLDILLDHGTAAKYDTEDEEQKMKPTVRRNAQRYVLANLKFQSSAVKGDLITEGKILRRTLQGINRDGADIIADILHSVEKDILGDAVLSRKSKTRVFNPAILGSMASLYSIEDWSDNSDASGAPEGASTLDNRVAVKNSEAKQKKSIRAMAHDLLLRICTQQENGVLLSDSGWYPTGNDPEEAPLGQDEDSIYLGLDSPLYFDHYDHKIPVKNGTLSTFIQDLRPATDTLQAALLLKVFQAAPELIADYFSKRSKFTSEPKTDPGWLGEAAFLFSVIELPIPAYCGWDAKLPAMPPPVSIVIESILPRPLDQATITRCLNLNDEVVTLFAARVVTVALRKLRKILVLFCTAPRGQELWMQALKRLEKSFTQRSPPIKIVTQALQRAPKDNLQLRGAMIEFLVMYFKTLLSVASRERFDVSTALTEVLNQLDTEAKDKSNENELLEQISNLVFIAGTSLSTNWWNKSGSDLSIFCRLLRIAVSSSTNPNIKPVQAVLRTFLGEKGVLSNEERAFGALLASLASSKKWSPSHATFAFVDNCVERVVRQPVHYLDLITSTFREDIERGSQGAFLVCIAEQWPFVAKNDDLDAQKNVAEWIARFFSALGEVEEDSSQRKIATLREHMLEPLHNMPGSVLEKAFKKQGKHPIKLESSEDRTKSEINGDVEMHDVEEKQPEVSLEEIFGTPARSPDSVQGLDLWDNVDLESAVSSGRLGRLLQCIVSGEEEIRRQAFLLLRRLMAIVKESSYPEKIPVYLLLGEVCETVQNDGFETGLPSIVAEVAAQTVTIIADPSHKMYGKVNKFLNRAPSWDAQKVISYWTDRILLKEPEDDDGHDLEVNWLLQLLINGLRDAKDMELYRKANVFERILSLYTSPQISMKVQHKILQLVYRAVQVGGGMTLITRAGILSWIDIQVAVTKGQDTGVLLALKSAIEVSIDRMEVEAWKTRSTK